MNVQQLFLPFMFIGRRFLGCKSPLSLISISLIKSGNRVIKVIASITEGSQESLRALVLHYSARYSPLECLKSLNPYSVWSSRLEL